MLFEYEMIFIFFSISFSSLKIIYIHDFWYWALRKYDTSLWRVIDKSMIYKIMDIIKVRRSTTTLLKVRKSFSKFKLSYFIRVFLTRGSKTRYSHIHDMNKKKHHVSLSMSHSRTKISKNFWKVHVWSIEKIPNWNLNEKSSIYKSSTEILPRRMIIYDDSRIK